MEIQRVVREVVVRGVSEGVDVAATYDKVAAASGRAAAAVERNNRVSESAERAIHRIAMQYDDAYRAQTKYAEAERALQRAREQGLIDQQRHAELLERVRQRTGAGAAANDNLAKSAGLARHELINLGRQAQDVGTMLAMGASPMTVLTSQAAQVADIFMSSQGTVRGFFGQLWSGVTRVLTPIRLMTGGMLAFGAAAVTAALQWGSAQRDIDRGLFGAGRASGATRGDINAIADRQSSLFGLSRSEAREFATTIAASGAVARQNIEPLVAIGKDVARVYGVDATEAAQMLAKAMMDPAKGARELNQRLGNIDAATVRQITNLQAQNRLYEAQALLTERVRQGVDGISAIVTTSANFWTGVGNAVSNLWDAIGEKAARITGIGLTKGLEEKIAEGEKRIAELEARTSRPFARSWRGSAHADAVTAAALTKERADLERNKKALDDYRKSAEDAQNVRRSFATEATVRALLPEIGALEGLRNQHTLLNLAMMQVEATGGRNSKLLTEWGVTYEQLTGAVNKTASAMKNFKTEFEQAIQAQNLSIRAVGAFSPTERAQIAYEQRLAAERAAKRPESEAQQLAEGERTRVLKEYRVQVAETARERELAGAQAVRAAAQEITLVGKSTFEQERLRAIQQTRFQLEQEAARTRTLVNGQLSAQDQERLARLTQQINLESRLKDIQAREKLRDDLAFEREGLFLPQEELRIAERLRSIYPDINTALASQEAIWMRNIDRMKELRDGAQGLVSGIGAAVLQGKSLGDVLKQNATNVLGRMIDKQIEQGLNAMLGLATKGMGVPGLSSITTPVMNVTAASVSIGGAPVAMMGLGGLPGVVPPGGAAGLPATYGGTTAATGWNASAGVNPMFAALPAGADRLSLLMAAVKQYESGGNYNALGPITKSGDRAYGAFQVMGNNIGPWSEKWYGQRLTPTEFLRNREAQDIIARGQLGSYYEKYGDRAASAWFAGEGGMNDLGRKDVIGTRVSQYQANIDAQMKQLGASMDGAAIKTQALGTNITAVGTASQAASVQAQSAANTMQLSAAQLGQVGAGVGTMVGVVGASLSKSPTMRAIFMGATPLLSVLGKGLFSGLAGFDDGGYTGAGYRGQPKGIAHANEIIWSADDIRRGGGVSEVEALRRGRRQPIFIEPPAAASAPVSIVTNLHVAGSVTEGGMGELRAELDKRDQIIAKQFGQIKRMAADSSHRNKTGVGRSV